MTTNRDPDRIVRAWLDLMPDEAPDRVLSAVSQAVSTTPQVRHPFERAFRRFPQMNRLSIAIAAAAVVVVAIVGASMILKPSASIGGPQPTVGPTPLVSGLGRGMGFATAAPTALADSDWVADAGPIQGLFHDARIRLQVTAAGQLFSVVYAAGTPPLRSQPVTGPADTLALISLAAASGCAIGDYGTYSIVLGSDGATLTLTVQSEACGSRASLLARTWTRALDAPNKGGRGVVAIFDPAMLITLPGATYTTDVGADGGNVSSANPDRTLIAVKNPAGFTDPCAASGGSPLPEPHTIAAFATYLESLPGLTVQSQAITIDGHQAAHLVIPTTETTDCPSHNVMEWAPGDVSTQGGWHITQGDTDVVYLVEVGSDLYLLQWLGAGVTPAEELSVLSTAHFVSSLPTGG